METNTLCYAQEKMFATKFTRAAFTKYGDAVLYKWESQEENYKVNQYK